MLERIDHLPARVIGVRAVDVVSPSDVREILTPALKSARERGERIRLLYVLGADHVGFSPGPSWIDQHLDAGSLRLLDRCAIVSDRAWVHEAHSLLSMFIPCPVRVFESRDMPEAIGWLQNRDAESVVSHHLISELSVLVVEPEHSLHTRDFDAVSKTIDVFNEGHGPLRGMVVHTRHFPGWHDLGAFLRHLRFIREHHHSVQRVALVIDSSAAEVGQRIAQYFVDAELEHFDYDDLDAAIAWAGGRSSRGRARASGEEPTRH